MLQNFPNHGDMTGQHSVYNGIATIAAAHHVGVAIETACAALGEVARKYPKASVGVRQGVVETTGRRIACTRLNAPPRMSPPIRVAFPPRKRGIIGRARNGRTPMPGAT